jgi:sulfatase maturation enzyme AslB (radical SAM superfamily)
MNGQVTKRWTSTFKRWMLDDEQFKERKEAISKNWLHFQLSRTIPATHKLISCYAPFNHLQIDRIGRMRPCCFHQGPKPISLSKDQHDFRKEEEIWDKENLSLKDYWFGDLAESYRESMLNAKNLDYGCMKKCGNCIVNKIESPVVDYDWNVGEERLDHALSETPWPKIIDFQLSNLCNMACPMCWGELSSKHMLGRDKDIKAYNPNVFDDDENLDVLLTQFEEFIPHLEEIRFVGGEPLAHKAFYRICKMIREINPKLSIQICTNGSVFNKKVEKICRENNVKLSISCDTVIKEEYETIRIGGKYEETWSNIAKFKEIIQDPEKVIINTTVTKINAKNISQFFKYAMEKKHDVFVNIYSYPGSKLSPNWGLHLTPKEDLQSSIDDLLALDETLNKNINFDITLSQYIMKTVALLEGAKKGLGEL